MAYEEFVASRFKDGLQMLADPGSNTALSLLHAAIGIVGELYEYRQSITQENAREELGDTLFYLVAAAQAVGVNTVQGMGLHGDTRRPLNWDVGGYAAHAVALDEATETAHTLLDLAKKYAIYGKLVDVMRVRGLLADFAVWLMKLAHREETTIAGLVELNRTKLEKRYPQGYSNEAAQARADKTGSEE